MIKEIYEASGYRIVGLSHTNKVVNDMRSDGFEESYTLSRFLLDQKKRSSKIDKPNKKTVIMVDEAAMLSLKQDEALFGIVKRSGAKLVYVGDENQFPSIDRGNAFGRYAQEVGFESLQTIMRQTNDWDKEVSRKLGTGLDSSKPIKEAEQIKERAIFEALSTIKQKAPETLVACKDDEASMHALVGEWIRDSGRLERDNKKESRFIIAQTNRQVNALNDIVQQSEIEAGRVDRGSLQRYETVVQRENPHTGQMEVADTNIISVGVGSRIQFGRTDHDQGIANGVIGCVQKINGSKITVELDEPYQGKEQITFDTNEYADFSLGYAGTNYKAQGKTFDTCYVLDSNNWTSNAFYVAMSRARGPRKFFYSKKRHRNLARMAHFVSRSDQDAVMSSEFGVVSRARNNDVSQDLAYSKRLPQIGDAFDKSTSVSSTHDVSLQRPSNDN
jgi:ATP-dependent exoDNAse (exonuclease V) alpha subunit